MEHRRRARAAAEEAAMGALERREVELLAETQQEIERLLDQARDDGRSMVEAARGEADELLRLARDQARTLLEAAATEADRLIREAGRGGAQRSDAPVNDPQLASGDGLVTGTRELEG